MKIADKERFYTVIITILAIIFLILIAVLAVQELNKEHEVERIESYTITSGETLWSIGTEYRPNDMSIQEYIYNIREYNNIGSIIYPGQTIQLLIYKEG